MSLFCGCPLDAEIPTIPVPTCEEDFGEIVKVIIQRTKNGSAVNEIVIATSDPTLLATWTALKAAADSTKIQITPEIPELAAEEQAPREASSVGIGGIAKTLGSEFTPMGGYFHSQPQSVMKEIRKYNCESGVSIFPVNEFGQIGCLADDNTAATKVKGIPVRSLFIGPKIPGGRNDVDKNRVQWRFLPDYSDEFYIINPSDFNPLEDL